MRKRESVCLSLVKDTWPACPTDFSSAIMSDEDAPNAASIGPAQPPHHHHAHG